MKNKKEMNDVPRVYRESKLHTDKLKDYERERYRERQREREIERESERKRAKEREKVRKTWRARIGHNPEKERVAKKRKSEERWIRRRRERE